MNFADIYRRLPYSVRLRLWWLDVQANGVWTLLREGHVQTEPETLSHQFAEMQAAGDPIGIEACRLLDAADPGHCERVLKEGDHEPQE